ncbi:hypothetical protein TSUD_307480 [Trifolium subterraneum]|nr:hypothetical protein TSUD_307480 [Trifolium subterraneum]
MASAAINKKRKSQKLEIAQSMDQFKTELTEKVKMETEETSNRKRKIGADRRKKGREIELGKK